MSRSTIRAERPADVAAIFEVERLAFGRDDEARLVDRLRNAAPTKFISLVALDDETVIGHTLLTPVTILAPEGESTAMGLGPVAVVPHRQREGIGDRLVRAGLTACDACDEPVVFVLGHASYYPRFGFESSLDKNLFYRNEAASASFFVAERVANALDGRTGEVRYHPAFDAG